MFVIDIPFIEFEYNNKLINGHIMSLLFTANLFGILSFQLYGLRSGQWLQHSIFSYLEGFAETHSTADIFQYQCLLYPLYGGFHSSIDYKRLFHLIAYFHPVFKMHYLSLFQ